MVFYDVGYIDIYYSVFIFENQMGCMMNEDLIKMIKHDDLLIAYKQGYNDGQKNKKINETLLSFSDEAKARHSDPAIIDQNELTIAMAEVIGYHFWDPKTAHAAIALGMDCAKEIVRELAL